MKTEGGFSAREKPALHELPFVKLCEAKAAQAVASSVTDHGSAEPEPASRGQAELRGVGNQGRLQPVPPELGHPPVPSVLLWEAAADRQAAGQLCKCGLFKDSVYHTDAA